MRQVPIALNDELSQKLDGRASELGLALDEFLAQAIEQNADKLIRPKVWMPREKWDAMDYQILGNGGPRLHCFLQPRFYGDSEPGWPIDPCKEQVILRPEEYQKRVRAIQMALEKVEH